MSRGRGDVIRGPEWTAIQAFEESRRLISLRTIINNPLQYSFNDRRKALLEASKLEVKILFRAIALEGRLCEQAQAA